MPQNQPLQGLGGFSGFRNQQAQGGQNPNARFNRPAPMPNQMPGQQMGMRPQLGNPQAPPPVQNQMPVNPQMNQPNPQLMQAIQNQRMQQNPMMQRQSQVPPQVMQNPAATNLQDVLMRLRQRGY